MRCLALLATLSSLTGKPCPACGQGTGRGAAGYGAGEVMAKPRL